jgi:hypothetical protein
MTSGIHSPTKMMARGIKIGHILTIMLTSGQIVILVNLTYQIEQNDDMGIHQQPWMVPHG